MRKIFLLILSLAALLLVSCKKESNLMDLPQVNFQEARYVLGKGTVTIQLMADAPMTQRVEVPYSFYGKAVEGEDFTTSAKAFVFEAGQKESSITLTRIETSVGDEVKELTVNLGKVPAGFRLGVMNFTTVELYGNQSVFFSFDAADSKLTESGSYGIYLERMNGDRYRVTAETLFPLEVDPSSTAVEGEHFEFVDGKNAVVKRNRNTGTVSLRYLKKEEGKDKIVLRLKDKEGYAFGNNRTITITILGPYNLSGTWQFDKVSNLDWFNGPAWGGMIDTKDFPTGTAEDKITFVGEASKGYNFTPDLKGDLKNFFIAPCYATYKGEVEKDLQELTVGGRYLDNVAQLEFEKVNVNFSPTDEKIRPALVGFRIIVIGGEEILECTMDDFEPTLFLADAYGMMGDLTYTPLRLHFKRVK